MRTEDREPEEGRESAEDRDIAATGPGGSPAGRGGGSGGSISIGVLTGGAVAAGDGAAAEDRSLRDGPPAPPLQQAPGAWGPSVAPSPPSGIPGGIGIGVMAGGAAAAGAGARALDASTQSAIDAPPELRAALATLRRQLPLLNATDETSEIDAQLADAEEEIDATGQVRRDRLQRLRDRLELGTTGVAGLASATAVVQQILQLLGGQS